MAFDVAPESGPAPEKTPFEIRQAAVTQIFEDAANNLTKSGNNNAYEVAKLLTILHKEDAFYNKATLIRAVTKASLGRKAAEDRGTSSTVRNGQTIIGQRFRS